MEIASAYLQGIEMTPILTSMTHEKDVIHLEMDVHAIQENGWGFPDGAWLPYLSINYIVTKEGDPDFKEMGQLLPMITADVPHYAHSVQLTGAGTYHVTYEYMPPDEKGFWRHTDKETGVAPWFKPFKEQFTFKYPQD